MHFAGILSGTLFVSVSFHSFGWILSILMLRKLKSVVLKLIPNPFPPVQPVSSGRRELCKKGSEFNLEDLTYGKNNVQSPVTESERRHSRSPMRTHSHRSHYTLNQLSMVLGRGFLDLFFFFFIQFNCPMVEQWRLGYHRIPSFLIHIDYFPLFF